MINFCTVSDSKYILQGLTLFRSLKRGDTEFILHYLCIDDKSYNIIKSMNDNSIIPYSIDTVLSNSTLLHLKNAEYKYFCYSLASYFTNMLLDVFPKVIYLDSDIYFHKSFKYLIDDIGKADVGIFRHRQFGLSDNRPEGLFNVGVVYFNNSDIGKYVCNWWSDAVLYKKYPHLATCGDQKYLEEFSFFCNRKQLFVDGNIGHGAPWQWQLYDFSEYINTGNIIWDGVKQPLVFSHFSQFNYNKSDKTYIPSTMHHIYTPLDMYKSNIGLKRIYDEYFTQILQTEEEYYG